MNTAVHLILTFIFFAARFAAMITFVVKSRGQMAKAALVISVSLPVLGYVISVIIWAALPESKYFTSKLNLYAILFFELIQSQIHLGSLIVCGLIGRKNRYFWFPVLSFALLFLAITLPISLHQRFTYSLPGMQDERLFILILLFTVVLFILLYFFLISLLPKTEKQEAQAAFKQETDVRHVLEINEMYERTRKLSHEIKSQLAVVEEMIREGHVEEGASYLRQIREEFHPVILTGCPPMDALITLKDFEIRSLGFEFHYELCPLGGLGVTESDLCSLAGNLLDNAIEACTSEKRENAEIVFKILHVRDMLFLQCKNPTFKKSSAIVNGSIHTTKDPEAHGFGIPIMREILKKYGGELKIGIAEEQFIAIVSLPLQTMEQGTDA